MKVVFSDVGLGGILDFSCPAQECTTRLSRVCGSLPTLVGGADTFFARGTRMHFVWQRGMHVCSSRMRAVVVVPSIVCVRLPVRASRCGCMLSLHICELVRDITSFSYVY